MLPNASETENLVLRVRELHRNNASVEAVILVTVDGFSRVSSLPVEIDNDLISASVAEGASLASNLIQTFMHRTLDFICVEGQHGRIVIMPLVGDKVLAVLAKDDTRLGLLLMDMKRFFNSPGLDSPLASAPDPILPPRPPRQLNARARPRYDD